MIVRPTAREQTDTARALVKLVTQFPELPAANFAITGQREAADLTVNVHRTDSFERWREALHLDPQTASVEYFAVFQAIEIFGRFSGVRLRLVGYLPLPTEAADRA
jgi:hypothetical protein